MIAPQVRLKNLVDYNTEGIAERESPGRAVSCYICRERIAMGQDAAYVTVGAWQGMRKYRYVCAPCACKLLTPMIRYFMDLKWSLIKGEPEHDALQEG